MSILTLVRRRYSAMFDQATRCINFFKSEIMNHPFSSDRK